MVYTGGMNMSKSISLVSDEKPWEYIGWEQYCAFYKVTETDKGDTKAFEKDGKYYRPTINGSVNLDIGLRNIQINP